MGSAAQRDERRAVKQASRRRRRGGSGKGPVSVQRLARNVVDTADTATHAARSATAAALAGDRPYWVGLLAMLAAGALMLVGPYQSFLDGRDRVELLERQSEALDREIASLEQERLDLLDPDTIELRAREQLGLIKPGEVPFAVVPPEVERPLITPSHEVDAPEPAWYRRWWDAATSWLG